MKAALAQAMEEGAIGFSTGLIYAPGCFAEMEEIVELAKVTKEHGGVYASHIRNERDLLEEAVDEALAIGKAADINVLVSHLKAAEQPNWGKIPAVLQKLEAFNAENEVQAWIDVYPYTAVSTKVRAFIPKHLLQDGMAALPEKMSRA
jgi:N-acyl-D-aspartate/D-glutamate deacylase